MDSVILAVSFPTEFSVLPEPARRAWVMDWIQDFLIPVLIQLPKNLKHFIGGDFARSGDLTAIWVLTQSQTLKLHTPLVLEIRNCPFEQQKQILFRTIEGLPNFQAGALDARGLGAQIAEATADQFGHSRIEQVMPTLEWYRLNMPPIKTLLEDGEISLPKDDDILSDLRFIKKTNGIPKIPETKTKGTDGQQRHGDTAIALAMALYAARQMNPAPIEYTPLPSKLDRWSSSSSRWDDDDDSHDKGCY